MLNFRGLLKVPFTSTFQLIINMSGGAPQRSTAPVLKSYSDDCNPLLKYCADHTVRLHPAQKELLDASTQFQHGGMTSDPAVSQVNMNLLKMMQGKKVLEIGLFCGYNALSCALAIPDDGKVVGFDITDEYWIKSGGKAIAEKAGLSSKIDLRVSPNGALELLDKMLADPNEVGTYDLAFIDADKTNYANYYEKSLKLLRPYGVICVDNSIWNGRVVNVQPGDIETKAIAELNDKIYEDNRVWSSLLMVGDGLHIAIVKPASEVGKFP